MFITLLIGGRDYGQMRQGLMDAEVARQANNATKPAIEKAETVTSAVTLASFAEPDVPAIVTDAPAVIAAAVVEPEPIVTPEPEVLPILYVKSQAINVREGPSTDYSIIGRLTRAEAVTVVEPEVDGWVRIRIEGDGIEGFVAARLMTDQDLSAN